MKASATSLLCIILGCSNYSKNANYWLVIYCKPNLYKCQWHRRFWFLILSIRRAHATESPSSVPRTGRTTSQMPGISSLHCPMQLIYYHQVSLDSTWEAMLLFDGSKSSEYSSPSLQALSPMKIKSSYPALDCCIVLSDYCDFLQHWLLWILKFPSQKSHRHRCPLNCFQVWKCSIMNVFWCADLDCQTQLQPKDTFELPWAGKHDCPIQLDRELVHLLNAFEHINLHRAPRASFCSKGADSWIFLHAYSRF